MERDPDLLINALRFWGRIGFFFFAAIAMIITGVVVGGGKFSFRAVLVICAILGLGFIALGLAAFYEWIAGKLSSRGNDRLV